VGTKKVLKFYSQITAEKSCKIKDTSKSMDENKTLPPFSLVTCFQKFHSRNEKNCVLQVLQKSNYVTHAGQMARDV
jgi:hypothetical protein